MIWIKVTGISLHMLLPCARNIHFLPVNYFGINSCQPYLYYATEYKKFFRLSNCVLFLLSSASPSSFSYIFAGLWYSSLYSLVILRLAFTFQTDLCVSVIDELNIMSYSSICCKWQNFLFCCQEIFHSTFVSSLIPYRLIPYLGYCEQYCNGNVGLFWTY